MQEAQTTSQLEIAQEVANPHTKAPAPPIKSSQFSDGEGVHQQSSLLDYLFADQAAESGKSPQVIGNSAANSISSHNHQSQPHAQPDSTAEASEKLKGICKANLPAQHPQPEQITPIEIRLIVPNPNQPRRLFSEASILKLADSIRQFGIIQPLTVRKLGHLYELIAGERRLRAAKELGWSTVPCIINDVSEEKSAQISIIENLLREDLNIFEQAMAIEALIDTYSLTQEQIAEKLSSSQSYIANKLRLLRLSAEEREKILSNNLTERHARALLRINDQGVRCNLLETVIKNELNVSSTEELVMNTLDNGSSIDSSSSKKTKTYKDIPSFYNAVSKAINCAKSSNLGIKCRKIVGEAFTELTILIPNQPNLQEKYCDDLEKHT